MKTEWTISSGLVQGDITYLFRTSSLTHTDVDFSLVAYGEKWDKFDISFSYRAKSEEEWRNDAFITMSNANKIYYNTIVGLDCSKYGSINYFRWEYTKNSIVYGENIEVKISILPRIRHFSAAIDSYSVSQIYNRQNVEINGAVSNVKVLNTNNDDYYICTNGDSVFVRETLNGTNLLIKSSFNNPVHAVQIQNRNYIICDYGLGQVIELDESLTTTVKTFNISGAVFFDYNEQNETVLITRKDNNVIEEYTWKNNSYGDLLWGSTFAINAPESASYKVNNAGKIVIADYKNDRIVLFDKIYNTTQYIDKFRFYEEESSEIDLLLFYKPFRVFWLDETIYIVEKEGRILTFEEGMSSSSESDECPAIPVGEIGDNFEICIE